MHEEPMKTGRGLYCRSTCPAKKMDLNNQPVTSWEDDLVLVDALWLLPFELGKTIEYDYS